MDKSHVEMALSRKITVEEFVEFAERIWGDEVDEISAACSGPIVLLLGAGASRSPPVALPIMSEFMRGLFDDEAHLKIPADAASHLLPRWQNIANILREILLHLKEVLGRMPDLEELLCFFQMVKGSECPGPVFHAEAQQLAEVVERWKNDIESIHEAHKLFVYRIIETYSGVDAQCAAELYAPLFNVLFEWLKDSASQSTERPVLPIYTTNYDRCIEGAANWSTRRTTESGRDQHLARMPRLALVDGFLKQRGEWIWTPAADFRGDRQVISKKTGEVGIPRYPSRFLNSFFWDRSDVDLFVPYFKLHGSCDWAYTESVIARVEREYWLWDKEQLSFYDKLRSEAWPGPPSFRPYVWEPGNKEWFTNAYQQIGYNLFRRTLATATVFIFVGYSFRDEHMLKCIQQANSLNNSLFTIAVDPCESFIPEFVSLTDPSRFEHIRTGLCDSVDRIRAVLDKLPA